MLAACSGPDRPPADDVAEAFAGALQSRDLSDVPLQAGGSVDPQTQLDEILEPLVGATGKGERAVTVSEIGDVVEADDAVTVPVSLDWRWEVAQGTTWEYSTTADLAYAPPADGGDDEGSWEVVWRPDVLVPDLAPGERVEVERLEPDRADVLDVDDEPLVTERKVWHLGVDKTAVEGLGIESAARELAQLVGLEPNEFFAHVDAQGEKAFVEAITVRDVNPGVDFALEDALEIPGVLAVEDTLELAPYGDFAAPILGRSGDATAEVIKESDGRVREGDVAGLSGLQRQYDAQLAGTSGVVVRVVPPGGSSESLDGSEEGGGEADEPREVFRVDAVDGTPVRTTLDVDLQTRAEDVLDDVDPASAIVAVRPSTGAVLAAASGPGSGGWSTATLGQYPPGSTFKIVDALAFQRAGLTPDSTVECTDTITVDGRVFSNVPGYPTSALGDVPLSSAFAHSCNTAMIAQRDAVAQSDLASAAAGLGLVDDEAATTSMGVAAFLGSVPAEADGTEHAASMIGQGKVQASPLGMATVAASVVAGEPVAPVLVRSDEEAEASEGAKGAVTGDEAAVLRDLMRGVVTDGSGDVLQDVPGVVGAKTGTAQYGDGSKQHVWMVAIKDDLAVAVFVEDGHRGSDTAGPLMHDFLSGL
ncbi:penicillin-binding transpeptidase domain-containing protein [Isoptericola hypogeus]|uniref:Beta-lactamase n=1 Tax=Isoptericola hypogeus TaxID=300179 RepID=A0ABN2JHY8_9MICO